MSEDQPLSGHRDLKVYRLAYKLAMEIFETSKEFPKVKNIHSPIKSAIFLERSGKYR